MNDPSRPEKGWSVVPLVMVAVGSFFGLACSEQSSTSQYVPKGDRVLSIQVNMGGEGDFDAIFKESLEAGNEAQSLSLDWNELEMAPGLFQPKTNFLAIANVYYSARKIPLHVILRPIHTNQKDEIFSST